MPMRNNMRMAVFGTDAGPLLSIRDNAVPFRYAAFHAARASLFPRFE
jgi:hypothetical protein